MRRGVEVVIGEIEAAEVVGGALIEEEAGEVREVIDSSDYLARYSRASRYSTAEIFTCDLSPIQTRSMRIGNLKVFLACCIHLEVLVSMHGVT